MPTPDPIALPELPEPAGRISRPSAENSHNRSEPYFTVRQMRAYGQACVDALTPAPQVPEGMVLVPREATEEMARAGAQDVSCLSRFGAKVCYEAMIAAALSASDNRDQ